MIFSPNKAIAMIAAAQASVDMMLMIELSKFFFHIYTSQRFPNGFIISSRGRGTSAFRAEIW